MGTDASRELVEVVLARREQLGLRMAIGAGIALAIGTLVGWTVTLEWLGGWYAIQLLEYWYSGRLGRSPGAVTWSRLWPAAVLLFLTNLAFGAIAMIGLASRDPWTMMASAWILTGGLLNAAATSRTSRIAFMVGAAPSALYCAAVPLMAASEHASFYNVTGLVAGSGLLIMSTLILRAVGLRALRQARDASAAKSLFLANMSHEIRTPMNGVLGMAQAMAHAPLPAAQRRRLQVIQESGETLLALLNQVLDLSKIEAGKLELEDGLVDMDQLPHLIAGVFGPICEETGVSLVFEVAPPAAGVWRGDPVRVRQILTNLVSNAVKFTEHGAVRVTARHHAEELVIEVADTGPGIPHDRLESLFDKFVQADASTTRRYGGTGLGLAISRELAQAMGGSLTATSLLGAGSTFILRLPLQRAEVLESPGEAHPRTVEGLGLKVLAAEDHAINQLVLKTLLEQLGLQPVIVADGQAAVEAWAAEHWDVILMDVQMPVMDGPTAAQKIREAERAHGRPRTTILALTANAMEHQRSDYLASGMDGVLTKPIELARLTEALRRAAAALEADDDARIEGAA